MDDQHHSAGRLKAQRLVEVSQRAQKSDVARVKISTGFTGSTGCEIEGSRCAIRSTRSASSGLGTAVGCSSGGGLALRRQATLLTEAATSTDGRQEMRSPRRRGGIGCEWSEVNIPLWVRLQSNSYIDHPSTVMHQGKSFLEGAPAVLAMLFRIQLDIVRSGGCRHLPVICNSRFSIDVTPAKATSGRPSEGR